MKGKTATAKELGFVWFATRRDEREPTAMKAKAKEELKVLIHEHSLFFDSLVELIPARFYLPGNDPDEPRVWFQGLSKQEKASTKKETRENLKKARRQRLDPENRSSTLELLKKSITHGKSLESEEEEEEEEEEGSPVVPDKRGLNPEGAESLTYEELQERLHRRIQELRGNRNTRTISSSGYERKPKSIKKLVDKNRSGKDESKKKDLGGNTKANDVSTDLTFSQLKIDGRGIGNERKKKRKASKDEELKRAKRLKKAMDDPLKGASVSTKHKWSAAENRAAGQKVHDDPKLLKQSMKKDKKRKQKSAQKWKERIQTAQKHKATKQQTRTENIAHRAQDKKMRRIAKREKKLMRPGFEGRKDGFINES